MKKSLLWIPVLVIIVSIAADFASSGCSTIKDKISFTSERDGNYEVYIMNVDGSGQTDLTNNPAVDGLPCFSP
jgi:Tol biopolymer transport system component